jgi:hypothetical protein
VPSPTRSPESEHHPTGPTGPTRRAAQAWLRRLTRTIGATTAGSVLMVGAPAVVPSGSDPAPSPVAPGRTVDAADDTLAMVAMVAADPRRWPGRPGRSVVRYRVRPGDTATGLAVRFHAWTDEIRAINRLGRHGRLFAGERIRIPVVVAAVRKHRQAAAVRVRRHRTGPARAHRAHRAHPHRARHHRAHHHRVRHHRPDPHRVHHRPRPWRHADASRAQVRRLVARTARRHGVDAQVALALSWQESGWQQRRISSAGAIGAMQVMPGTGRWMSLYVDRRLNLYSLRDNVTAGIVLFKVLRGQTSWRRSIASYYQGLGSVRRRGLYPSTKRYTRNVAHLYRRLQRGWDPA